MEIVVEIPDNEYHQICELRLHNRTFYDDAIRNGTPLPKGHWIDHQEGEWIYVKCSECGTVHDTQTNYCPNCGADMRGEQANDSN